MVSSSESLEDSDDDSSGEEDDDDLPPKADQHFQSLDVRKPGKTPLRYWYGCRRVGTVKPGFDGVTELVHYDAALLTTIRSLFMKTGTVLMKSVLWIEEGITIVTFFLAAAVTHWMMQGESDGIQNNINEQVQHMQDFCQTMTRISTFLMAFFTTLNFTRWMRLRHQGVEQMWSAAGRLNIVISTFITNDAKILSAIDRYTRASLMLIFMSQRGKRNFATLAKRGVLYPDEAQKLASVMEPMFASMSIWTWLAAIISGMMDKGMIKSQQLYRSLIDSVAQGHNASHLMVTQLTAPVPMSYVWLISFVVKIHNFVYAMLYGIMVTVRLWTGHQRTTCTTQCMFLFMVTLLFHAMLILNQDLTNPFNGVSQDVGFPAAWLDRKIKQDNSNYKTLAGNLPEWVEALGLTVTNNKLL